MTDDDDVTRAADELRTIITRECGRLADEILGRPELGSDEWISEQGTQGTPEGQARLREWQLTKVRIYRAADVDPTGAVINARENGATWQDIGDACGMARQSAFERWAKFTDQSKGAS
jgi:hypothetical protein